MLTKSLFSSVIIMAIIITSCASARVNSEAPASRGNWERLGERRVDYRVDHDVVNIVNRKGPFKQLRFVVRQGSLNMYKCVVYFENGGRQEIDLRHSFARGTESRIVDLTGNQRRIDRISFWYDSKNFSNNKAVLVIWGK